MVDAPLNASLLVEAVRARHDALGADLAVKGEAADRLVDQVDGVLVANVANVGAANGAVSLNGNYILANCFGKVTVTTSWFSTYTHGAGTKLGKGVLAALGAGDRPGARALDVAGNLLAVADLGGSAAALVDEAAVTAVVDGDDGAEGGSEGEDGELHFVKLVICLGASLCWQ